MKVIVSDLSEQYNEAYHEAQALLDEHNPCQIKIHDCGGATCAARDEPGQVCCIGCDYHSDKGCTVQCLGCKLHLCYNAGHHDELRTKLHRISKNLPYGSLLSIRASKEDTFKRIAGATIASLNG